jgi:hypothetical protein
VRFVPYRAGVLHSLVLLGLSLLVLAVALRIGSAEVTGLAARFATASLCGPCNLSF